MTFTTVTAGAGAGAWAVGLLSLHPNRTHAAPIRAESLGNETHGMVVSFLKSNQARSRRLFLLCRPLHSEHAARRHCSRDSRWWTRRWRRRRALPPILTRPSRSFSACLRWWRRAAREANAQASIGITVFTGMIASTCLAVLFVPSFFVLVQRFEEWRLARRPSASVPAD
jgi:hypothetical protein